MKKIYIRNFIVAIFVCNFLEGSCNKIYEYLDIKDPETEYHTRVVSIFTNCFQCKSVTSENLEKNLFIGFIEQIYNCEEGKRLFYVITSLLCFNRDLNNDLNKELKSSEIEVLPEKLTIEFTDEDPLFDNRFFKININFIKNTVYDKGIELCIINPSLSKQILKLKSDTEDVVVVVVKDALSPYVTLIYHELCHTANFLIDKFMSKLKNDFKERYFRVLNKLSIPCKNIPFIKEDIIELPILLYSQKTKMNTRNEIPKCDKYEPYEEISDILFGSNLEEIDTVIGSDFSELKFCFENNFPIRYIYQPNGKYFYEKINITNAIFKKAVGNDQDIEKYLNNLDEKYFSFTNLYRIPDVEYCPDDVKKYLNIKNETLISDIEIPKTGKKTVKSNNNTRMIDCTIVWLEKNNWAQALLWIKRCKGITELDALIANIEKLEVYNAEIEKIEKIEKGEGCEDKLIASIKELKECNERIDEIEKGEELGDKLITLITELKGNEEKRNETEKGEGLKGLLENLKEYKNEQKALIIGKLNNLKNK